MEIPGRCVSTCSPSATRTHCAAGKAQRKGCVRSSTGHARGPRARPAEARATRQVCYGRLAYWPVGSSPLLKYRNVAQRGLVEIGENAPGTGVLQMWELWVDRGRGLRLVDGGVPVAAQRLLVESGHRELRGAWEFLRLRP